MVTSSAVKRPYTSELRAAQARATRRAIVEAAARLFVEQGYGETSVDAIAQEAGVSRKTVFTSVGGKAQALKLALDWAVAGDDEDVPVLERPHVAAGRKEPDPRRILIDFATNIREVGERTAALMDVLVSAAGSDPELRALADDLGRQRQLGMGVLAGVLAKRKALAPHLTKDEAADILWLLSDTRQYSRLVLERGWSPERFEVWTAEALQTLLLSRR